MARVYVSVGSNIEPLRYIRAGLFDMQRQYGQLTLSSVYESQAVGFQGDNFYNLVVGFDTTTEAQRVNHTLRRIEQANGRERESSKRLSARTLDLDLLLYDNLVSQTLALPRDDILKYAFVLLPLAEIIPKAKHPLVGQTYAELWQAFDNSRQPLWRIEINIKNYLKDNFT